MCNSHPINSLLLIDQLVPSLSLCLELRSNNGFGATLSKEGSKSRVFSVKNSRLAPELEDRSARRCSHNPVIGRTDEGSCFGALEAR